MASTTVKVHPLVLLNVMDHVTRFNLSHRSTPTRSAPPASRPSTFLSTAGLLIGTISSADAATTNAVLSSSFELPPKPDELGEPIPFNGTATAATPTAGGGGHVDLVRLVESGVDWDVARQHSEQLGTVMPESGVVGCYVVCKDTRNGHIHQNRGTTATTTTAAAAAAAASASKKPRNETQVDADVASTPPFSIQGIDDVAQSLAVALRQARLLPSAGAAGGGDGFVLLVVYDGEAAQRGSHHRLPFETLWVTSEQSQQQQNLCTAATASSTVTPSDMEWIGLALPAPSTGCAVSAVESGAPPRRPSFLRRCSDVLLSAATSGGASALQTPTCTSPLTPANVNGATSTALAACSPPSLSLLPHNGSAAGGLLSCLRLLTRAVDATGTAAVPDPESGSNPAAPSAGVYTQITSNNAEVLRTVATCVRNVPQTHTPSLQPQQRSAVTMTTGSAVEEDLVRAVLAMESRCAMQLSRLQFSQHGVVSRRRDAVNSAGGNRKGTPPRATAAAAAAAAAASATSGVLPRSSVSSSPNAAWRGGRDGPCGGGGDSNGRYPEEREGRTKSAPATVMYGYVQPR